MYKGGPGGAGCMQGVCFPHVCEGDLELGWLDVIIPSGCSVVLRLPPCFQVQRGRKRCTTYLHCSVLSKPHIPVMCFDSCDHVVLTAGSCAKVQCGAVQPSFSRLALHMHVPQPPDCCAHFYLLARCRRFHVECIDRWFLSSTDYSRPPACPL